MNSEEKRRIRRMLTGIDALTNTLYDMEGTITYHCNRIAGHECKEKCPMLVILSDGSFPPICAQRVIEQLAIQSHQRFDKEVKE